MVMKTTNTKGLLVIPYVETRDRMIESIVNATKTAYPDDKDMLLGVIDLTTTLKLVSPEEGVEFVQDMWGFMSWCVMTQNSDRSIFTTIIHDLGEFSRNRKEDWFCPRTSGYRKYLTGASGQI